MGATYTDEEAVKAFKKLETQLTNELGLNVKTSKLFYYEDDGCYSIDIEVIEGLDMWSSDLERLVRKMRTLDEYRFIFTGQSSDEDDNRPSNKYGCYLLE